MHLPIPHIPVQGTVAAARTHRGSFSSVSLPSSRLPVFASSRLLPTAPKASEPLSRPQLGRRVIWDQLDFGPPRERFCRGPVARADGGNDRPPRTLHAARHHGVPQLERAPAPLICE